MRKKAVLILGFVGVFSLSFVLMMELQGSEMDIQTEQSTIHYAQYEKELITTISVEEQNKVENGLDKQGFISQENGTGFYFSKVK